MSADGSVLDAQNDFESWARVSARLLRRPPAYVAGIIRDVGLEATWRTIDAHWYKQLLGDLEAGRHERVMRYRAICAEVLDARALSGAEVPSPLDAIRPPASTASPKGDDAFVTPPFAKRLAPVGVKPRRPTREQASTSLDMSGAIDQELAAERALSWPPERYAWLCAQLEQTPERGDEIWRGEGIYSADARAAVCRSWDRRFANDEAARRTHDGLIHTYRQALRKPRL